MFIGENAMFNTKRFVTAVFTLIVFGALGYGGDPWNEKKFSEWTDGDYKKFFTRSPWVKSHTRTAPTAQRGQYINPDAGASASAIERSSGDLNTGKTTVSWAGAVIF